MKDQNCSITTARLELVAGTAEMFGARSDDRESLARHLAARVPEEWPPDLYDQGAFDYTVSYLKANPGAGGWMLWFMLLRSPEAGDGARTAIGISGFKGKPAADGACEIGYSVLAEYQRAGYATEAVGALTNWAFSHPEVTRVVAETYPELKPSIRVMEKNGLRFAGDGSEERVVRYELTRDEWRRRGVAAG